jgi:hypothetical protein
MKKITAFSLTLSSLLFISYLLFVPPVAAVCPACTVAVVAGLGVSRALGIDDMVTSIWIGGLILSASFWLIDWVKKGGWLDKIKDRRAVFLINITITILIYLLVLIPLKFDHAIGILANRLWGIDKIILGVAIGSLVFSFGTWLDKKVRKVRGRQLFNYQRVVFPILCLIITSLIFFLITKY